MGWGGFLDQLLEKLPIQNRVERWKNKLNTLERERNDILLHKANYEKAKRLARINRDIDKLNILLRNKVS